MVHMAQGAICTIGSRGVTSLVPWQELPLRADRPRVPDDAGAVWLGPDHNMGIIFEGIDFRVWHIRL